MSSGPAAAPAPVTVPRQDAITAVDGVAVGHWSDHEARTGCTVVLLPAAGAVTSGRVAGPAPGSRETALLDPERTVQHAHALLLTGGSAFGLAAADGVMRWLEEQGRGHPTPFGPVGIVPSAALYDLGVGRTDVRPGAEAGWAAAEAARSDAVPTGRIGAGTGATAFKLTGFEAAIATGIGTAALRLAGVTVAAIAVSNAVGGLRDAEGDGAWWAGREVEPSEVATLLAGTAGANTTLVAVATDAHLDKAACRALADAGHVGIAHVTRPSHTASDGDTVFVAATGKTTAPPLAALGVAVQRVVARALLQGACAGGAGPQHG